MALKCDKPLPGWQGGIPGTVGIIPTAVGAEHSQGGTWEDAVLLWGG